jgi:hypothetical protein
VFNVNVAILFLGLRYQVRNCLLRSPPTPPLANESFNDRFWVMAKSDISARLDGAAEIWICPHSSVFARRSSVVTTEIWDKLALGQQHLLGRPSSTKTNWWRRYVVTTVVARQTARMHQPQRHVCRDPCRRPGRHHFVRQRVETRGTTPYGDNRSSS